MYIAKEVDKIGLALIGIEEVYFAWVVFFVELEVLLLFDEML